MKNMNKKLVAVLVAVFMFCSITTGFTKTTNLAKSSPQQFSIWTWLGSVETWGGKSYDEVLCYQQVEKDTNTKIKYVHPTGDAVESFNLMMTSGNMTDMIWYHWTPQRVEQYYKAGRIYDLAPYVRKYAPNLMKLMAKYPALKKQLYDPAGRMFYIPWVTLDKLLVNGEGMMIRKDWLDKVKMKVPTTNDELYKVLKAMKANKDINKKGDFVGLTGYSGQIYKLFYGFGTADDWYLENQKATYGPTTQKYKAALKWFNKLYTEGLLDKDYLSDDGDIFDKKNLNNQAAAWIDNYDSFSRIMKLAKDAKNPIDYTPVPYMKYNGKSVVYNSATKRVNQTYGLCITKSCKDPAAAVKYLDYCFSPAGQRLFNWGVEGQSYVMKNGLPYYSDKVLKDPKEVPAVAATKYTNIAWVGVEDLRTTTTLLDPLGVKTRNMWADVDNSGSFEPVLWLTDAQLSDMKQYTNDLNTFKNEWRDKFITGQESIDGKFDWYVEQLNKMGLKQATLIQQEAYNNYAIRH